MNAPLTKEHLSLFATDTLAQPRARVQARGLSAFARSVTEAARWLADWPRRHATIDELSRLSDRELADIGLTRAQVRTIFSRG